MSNFRTAHLPGRSSQNLGQALSELFVALYKSWYVLPKKSTRRHINLWREEHAEAVGNGHVSIDDITNLLDALIPMTGVQEAAGDELKKARQVVASADADLVDADSQAAVIADESKKLLAALLQTDDPAGYVIRQMVYDPNKVELLFEEVRAALSEVETPLPAEIQKELTTVWTDFETTQRSAPSGYAESREPYQKALAKLEQLPMVIRLTYEFFLRHKVDHADQIRTHRGGGPGIGRGGSIDRGSGDRGSGDRGSVKSPTFRGFDGPLESFSPGFEMAAEDAMAESIPEDASDGIVSDASEGVSSTKKKTSTLVPDVRFPESVQRRDEVPLIVQLTQQQRAESQVSGMAVNVDFDDPGEPEYVEVVLSASGFSELTDIWSRTIKVYSDQDSQPAIFLLKGDELGDYGLTIAFYHKQKQLGQVKLTATVSNRPTIMGTTPTKLQVDAIAAPAPPVADAADLELRITQGAEKNQLQFMLHSSKAQVGYHWRPVGEVTLTVENPQTYLEYKFQRMSALAGHVTPTADSDQFRKVMRELETFGEELFEDLFPEPLKSEYWAHIKPLREQGIIESFLITSDEPWIPWEMVKPYSDDPVNDKEETDGFLSIEFDFCRWLAGKTPSDQVAVDVVKTVIPNLDLIFAQQEQKYFQTLADQGVTVEGPLTTLDEVLESTFEGGFQVLHFALHGSFDAEQPGKAALMLGGNEKLQLDDFAGRQIRGLRRANTIVFINACHTARMNFSLTSLGGWAETMVNDGNVGAFIGAQWEVNDKLALVFATTFYDELRAGSTLGKAFNNARKQTRDLAPTNPTWLAYTLYGDPNSKVTWSA